MMRTCQARKTCCSPITSSLRQTRASQMCFKKRSKRTTRIRRSSQRCVPTSSPRESRWRNPSTQPMLLARVIIPRSHRRCTSKSYSKIRRGWRGPYKCTKKTRKSSNKLRRRLGSQKSQKRVGHLLKSPAGKFR